jgi:alpha-L-fucosidase
MSGRKAVHLLVDIVSKGGNLLLNIAPEPDGTWPEGAYKLLNDIGLWMNVNNEAIYETRAIAPYKEGNVCLTQGKDGSTYIIYLGQDGENAPPPVISMTSWAPPENATISMLGMNDPMTWEKNGEGFLLNVPEKAQNKPPCNYAFVFKVQGAGARAQGK